jgi:hypothetical protein
MSDTKHTPGPWHKEDRRPSGWLIVPSNPDITGTIAITSWTFRVSDGHEWTGNPDLLAAAPDLLEACEACFEAWDNDGKGEPSEAAFAAAIEMVRTAIAKAKGEADD